MLTSLGLVLLLGMALGALAKRLGLPSLAGMLIAGMVLGPYALNLLSPTLMEISADLRQLALIIILTRAGLSLDVATLKRVGRPAVLMCFVPACFEIAGMVLLAPRLLGVSVLDAAIMGAVVGAVSPAVIVPRMIRLTEEGYGVEKGIPQLVLAGASVDDVFVIVLFTAFTGLASGTGTGISPATVISVPVSILTGIVAGLILGWVLALFFRKVHMRDSIKVVILLSLAFLLVAAEDALEGIFPFSGLLAVMAAGVGLQRWRGVVAQRLSLKFSKLWVAAEVSLFVLVGAAVDLRYAVSAGGFQVIQQGFQLAPRNAGRSGGAWLPVLPGGGRAGLRGRFRFPVEGEALLCAGLPAQGYGAGRHRRRAPGYGSGLRTDRPHCGGHRHSGHRPSGRAGHRPDLFPSLDQKDSRSIR